jgi:hypothetical protein
MGTPPQKKHRRLSENAILGWCAGAVAVVIVYEVLKASEHAVLAGPGQSPDVPFTLFWIFDAFTAAIVTFALVYVSLSLRRMDESLHDHEATAEGILERLRDTASDVSRLQGELKGVQSELGQIKGDIENVSAGLISKDSILQGLESENLRKAYAADSSLQTRFLEGLRKLTTAWGTLIEDEFTNPYAIEGGTNYGLLCWKVAIQVYLEEEASDIKARTVATNIGLYLKLIESLVDEVLRKVQGTSTTVDLFASANILPVEYFNWRDDFAKPDRREGMPGISRSFMDEYRTKIKTWLDRPDGPTLTRVFLVDNLNRSPAEERQLLAGMSIQHFETLRSQAHLRILCESTSGKPKKMSVEQISAYMDVPRWLLEEHRESEAYAIAEHFHKSSKALASAGLKDYSLFEIVAGELHSKPSVAGSPNPHARYLEIAGADSLEYLKLLPKIPSSRAGEIRSPDFLVIRLRTESAVRTIACIAAELDPDYETMSLRLITSERELLGLERFIDYASRDSDASRPIGDLIQDA